MRTLPKKWRTQGVRKRRDDVKRLQVIKRCGRGRKSIRRDVALNPAEEWLHLSPADADTIVHLLKTPLRETQAMRDVAKMHAAIPQLG